MVAPLLLFNRWWFVVYKCGIGNGCYRKELPLWVIAEKASTDQELLVQGNGWCC
jgi:hypothetical protein